MIGHGRSTRTDTTLQNPNAGKSVPHEEKQSGSGPRHRSPQRPQSATTATPPPEIDIATSGLADLPARVDENQFRGPEELGQIETRWPGRPEAAFHDRQIERRASAPINFAFHPRRQQAASQASTKNVPPAADVARPRQPGRAAPKVSPRAAGSVAAVVLLHSDPTRIAQRPPSKRSLPCLVETEDRPAWPQIEHGREGVSFAL